MAEKALSAREETGACLLQELCPCVESLLSIWNVDVHQAFQVEVDASDVSNVS